jgi:hypothetical protein
MSNQSHQKIKKKGKFSQFYRIWVRPSIVQEFTQDHQFDDMMAGLHEIRARMAEKGYPKKLVKRR